MIATIARTLVRSLPLSRLVSTAVVLLGAAVLLPAPASAVSANVRNACVGDYFNFCAGMEVGSKELRRCFNRNGAKLSSACVSALVSSGEVSKAEVSRRSGKSKVAKARTKKKVVRTASRTKSTRTAWRTSRTKRLVASLR